MSHLGERLSALIDGELGHDERDRMLAHLAVCQPCRADAEAMRKLKGRLRSLDPASPSAELMRSLLQMSEPGGPVPPRPRSLPGHGGPAVDHGFGTSLASPYSAHPAGPGGNRRPLSRWVRYATVGAVSVVLVSLAAFAAGGRTPGPTAVVAPPLDLYAVEHARTSQQVPFNAPLIGAVHQQRVGP